MSNLVFVLFFIITITHPDKLRNEYVRSLKVAPRVLKSVWNGIDMEYVGKKSIILEEYCIWKKKIEEMDDHS